LQTLAALSNFPELKTIEIRIKIKSSKLALTSRPDWKNIFRPKRSWVYLIIISCKSKEVPNELLFSNLPFNAQIGILGHEFSHTIFYLNKSLTDIISIGIKYLNSNYRIKFEQETDRETIRRGLGWQLLEFAEYCRNSPYADSKYKLWLDKYYLQPYKIKEAMQAIAEYKIKSW
jgi:hypothetical protein